MTAAVAAGGPQIAEVVESLRAGHRMTSDEIVAIIQAIVGGATSDAQMAAWLATVASQGLDLEQLTVLTRAYAESGAVLSLRHRVGGVVDKHSTGGVGDTTSLVAVPIAAACGARVAKLSGRGLGFAGGTIDKLESIEGLRLSLTHDELEEMVLTRGMCIAAQSADLVPADRETYRVRDVTGTVSSIPLIAASIVSKKYAIGSQGVVFDVKFGRGALLPDVDDALELARTMVSLCDGLGLPAVVLLTDMDTPLGRAVGNALEVREAIDVLRGDTASRLPELAVEIAAEMVALARPGTTLDSARAEAWSALSSGQALKVFADWVDAQGGDRRQVEDPTLLPSVPHTVTVLAPSDGFLCGWDARRVGSAALATGAGRRVDGDRIELGAGVVLGIEVGERVRRGQHIATVHAVDPAAAAVAAREVEAAVELKQEPPAPAPIVHRVIRSGGEVETAPLGKAVS